MTQALKKEYPIASTGDVVKSILKYLKDYPDILSWNVYVEVLSTGDLMDKCRQNRKNPSSWKFIEYADSGVEEQYRDTYIDIAGGVGIDPKNKAVLICINY